MIVRGIERRNIFRDDKDRYNFLERMGALVEGSATLCYAWALIPNHFHLLLRTGAAPIATFMRRLLTGHGQAAWHLHAGGKQGGGPGAVIAERNGYKIVLS